MSCTFSREKLALYVEGDLPAAAADVTARHLAVCEECRQFLDRLHERQSLLKSLRRERVAPSECTGMRREVMAIINDRRDMSGWMLRIERALMLGARRSYALAGLVLLGIASVSLLALRHPTLDASQSAAVFVGKDTLVRPEGYRGWIRASGPGRTVYMNPAGYREFSRTGRVPDGALLIWESVGADGATGPSHQAHQASSVLLASVKDSSRFDGGWAFFDFTSARGGLRSNAKALPEASGCGTCHRPDAETDGVLTEFHLVL